MDKLVLQAVLAFAGNILGRRMYFELAVRAAAVIIMYREGVDVTSLANFSVKATEISMCLEVIWSGCFFALIGFILGSGKFSKTENYGCLGPFLLGALAPFFVTDTILSLMDRGIVNLKEAIFRRKSK